MDAVCERQNLIKTKPTFGEYSQLGLWLQCLSNLCKLENSPKFLQALPFLFIPETLCSLLERSKNPDLVVSLNTGFNKLQDHPLQATIVPISRPKKYPVCCQLKKTDPLITVMAKHWHQEIHAVTSHFEFTTRFLTMHLD